MHRWIRANIISGKIHKTFRTYFKSKPDFVISDAMYNVHHHHYYCYGDCNFIVVALPYQLYMQCTFGMKLELRAKQCVEV